MNLHSWKAGTLVSHTAVLGEFGGPHPFFDAVEGLIDRADDHGRRPATTDFRLLARCSVVS